MIKLEEICGYLPYKLNCIIEGDDEHIHTIVGFEDSLWGVLLISDKGDFGRCRYDLIKPILRNLSDLTREIEHNGEKFVPIVELAKIAYPKIKHIEFHIVNGMCFVDTFSRYRFEYNIHDKSFTCTKIDENRNCFVQNQLQLFQKLFEWHFWLGDQSRFGQDIIDINTLNE